MLEIRERSETTTAVTTKRIYASGAWTLSSDTATARGCFDRSELRSIRRALQDAAWKVTSSPIACFAYDPNFTEYVLDGKLRYTHRMCSGKTADFETMEAIELVNKELAEEMPPPPPPPPVKPPVAACKAEGMPLFEIAKRSDAKESTSTTKIYGTGAWTFQPIDKDGNAGALTTGCFDRPALAAMRTAINEAPWDVTFDRIVCRAYSASYTDYYVHGKHEYTERLCGGQRLDAESAGALRVIQTQLSRVLPAAS